MAGTLRSDDRAARRLGNRERGRCPMKRLMSLVAAVSIFVIGCGSGADGAATPTVGATATPASATAMPVPATATPESSPAPIVVPTIVSVTWDGTTCEYRGPAVFPREATVQWSFANIGPAVGDDSLLLVGPVPAGTTWDDVREAEKIPASQWPPPGRADLSLRYATVVPGDSQLLQMSGDMYYVGCGTPPTSSDRYTGADLVYVIGR
jgi:hypothetical protein